MSPHHGAHGMAGATTKGEPDMGAKARNECARNAMPEVPYLAASTDAALNARAKRPATRAAVRASRRRAALIAALLTLILLLLHAVMPASGGTVGTAGSDGAGAARNTITIGLRTAPVSLDIRRQSGAALEQILIGNVYEGLVARGEDNQPHPSLASSWDISADGLTYTFHLAEDARFSNGDTLDAEDAAWSLHELRARRYQNHDDLDAVETIETPDAHTLRLTLGRPDSELLWKLTGRAGLVYDRDGQWDDKSEALGSGPYTVASFDADDRLVLTANPDYWGQDHRARTRTIVLRFLTDENAAVNALTAGDAQILSPMSATLAARFRDDPDYQVKDIEGSDKFVLAFNMDDPTLQDQRIRQAIRYGIDHQQLIAARGGADSPLGGPIPATDPGYEDLTGLYPHDAAKARRLMAQAGYTSEHPLELTLTYANTYGTEIGDQLAGQLAAIGIDLHVDLVEFPTWLQDVHTNGDYQLSLVDHAESHDLADWTDPDYYFHYDNAQVRDLYQRALDATDRDQADSYLAAAARAVSADAPADWLFAWNVTTVIRKDVTGWPERLSQTVLPLWRLAYTA